MLENSIYSIISPEGCASILWRDANYKEEASKALKLTADDLKSLGVIDNIIAEPAGGAHRHKDETIARVKAVVANELKRLMKLGRKQAHEERLEKFEKMTRL
jgi:acetyl-CoA carboxylase carboxyl transferase subunit alpha